MAEVKKRILFVSQYFYPETFRGNEIAFEWSQKGHDVTVITGKPNYPDGKFFAGYSFWGIRKEVIQGVNVIRLPLIPRGNGKGVALILNYISFILSSYIYTHFFKQKKYDRIFIQQLSPVTMALPALWVASRKKNKNVPIYIWVLDLWPDSLQAATNIDNKIILGYLNYVVNKIYNSVDQILISSNGFKKSIEERLKSEVPISYFPNWADDALKNKIPAGVELPDLPKGFNIVFTGNIGQAQDFQTILEAAEHTLENNINWVIVGDGRMVDYVREVVSSKKLINVFLLGRFPIETMSYFYDRADVLLVTLKNDSVFNNTVPAKLQAYISTSNVVLGALNGEGRNLINSNKMGIAVASGEGKALGDAAVELRDSSKTEFEYMAKNGFNYYEKWFSKHVAMNNLQSILNL